MANVADYKKKTVSEFKKLIKEYPVIGVVNMESLPAPQLQKMRESLRGKVVIKMTKRRLMKIAVEESKKEGLEQIIPCMSGMPALIFTSDNPFMLYKKLQTSKSKAFAKAGQIAPSDIVVPAGPTPFAPGPIIGELGQLKIKTGVESGKVVIKDDIVVVKEGQTITGPVASVLMRLGIKPMEIGLNLTAVYENGFIFKKDVLAVDDSVYYNNLILAAKSAHGLALEVAYVCKETGEPLVVKAFKDAKSLCLSEGITAKGLMPDLIGKVVRQAKGLIADVKIEVS